MSRIQPHDVARVLTCEVILICFRLAGLAFGDTWSRVVQCKTDGVKQGGLARACRTRYQKQFSI